MREMPDRDPTTGAAPLPADGKRIDRMAGGMIASSALHLVAALLLVFGLPWPTFVPPPVPQIMSVNLVRLGAKTAAPPAPQHAPVPQAKATEVAKAAPAKAVPVAQAPPPPAAPHPAKTNTAPALAMVVMPARKPEVPRPTHGALASAKLRRQPSPADDFHIRLERLARLRQPAARVPPSPRRQDGPGLSNLTATSAGAARARDASYGVKDFIRAQVERRWNLDGSAVKGAHWVVAIHIVLDPDGHVRRADIVETQRYRSDSAYRDFALSARNAVLLSSPLIVPPGDYDIAKDIVLDFDSKQVLQ
ncbi:MAG TPA: hypothetical protein VMU87_03130 [Stellaceae bacterium]|nr:hypothetical protein [Stellaceae bacterium]